MLSPISKDGVSVIIWTPPTPPSSSSPPLSPSSCPDLLMRGLTRTQIYSCPNLLAHKITHTQTYSYSDLLLFRLTLGDPCAPRSRPFCGDASSGLAVCCPSVLCFRSRFGGCLERGVQFHFPEGSRRR
eukprot:8988157-Pyramimonas_sp.AAC.1